MWRRGAESIIEHMQSAVKPITCRGTTTFVHNQHTVAQFRHDDDGWTRVHNRGSLDPIEWTPSDELRVAEFRIECDHPGCRRRPLVIPAVRLYSLLDYAREHDTPGVPLG